jgi:hypothetical protein
MRLNGRDGRVMRCSRPSGLLVRARTGCSERTRRLWTLFTRSCPCSLPTRLPKKKILQGTGGTYITSILTTGSDLDGGRGSEVRSNKRAWWLTDVALAYFHFRFFYIIFVVCTSGMQESWRMYMFWANWWNCGRVANGDLPTLMHNIM